MDSFDVISYLMGARTGGGGGVLEYGEPIIRNWDFSMPINTRGQTTYTGSGGTINGWKQTSTTRLDLVSGGIKVQTNGGDVNMYFQLKVAAGMENVTYSGKHMTMSMMANNKLVSATIIFDTSKSSQGVIDLDGLRFWFNRDSAQLYAVGFQNTGAGDDTILQAIKLEYGDVSTLCTVKNGVATLLKHQNLDDERMFLSALAVND